MTCQRCHGLLVQVQQVRWVHWRCSACGDCFDTQVLTTRWLYRALKLLEHELYPLP